MITEYQVADFAPLVTVIMRASGFHGSGNHAASVHRPSLPRGRAGFERARSADAIRGAGNHVTSPDLAGRGDAYRIAATQGGVISRYQALAAGLGPDSIRRRLRAGRWIRVHAGVYAVVPGPPTLIRVWGGLLYAGAGAVASHQTAAWLDGAP